MKTITLEVQKESTLCQTGLIDDEPHNGHVRRNVDRVTPECSAIPEENGLRRRRSRPIHIEGS